MATREEIIGASVAMLESEIAGVQSIVDAHAAQMQRMDAERAEVAAMHDQAFEKLRRLEGDRDALKGLLRADD